MEFCDMMSILDTNIITSIKEVRIIVNDGLKYKRVYTIVSSTLEPAEVEEIQWFSTSTDITQQTSDKEWKEMSYNHGSKLEKLYQDLTKK